MRLAGILLDPFVLMSSKITFFFVIARTIESTSALDLEGEIEVWNSLMTELRGSTVICVTHVSESFFLLVFLELELEGRVTEIVIITQCYFPAYSAPKAFTKCG